MIPLSDLLQSYVPEEKKKRVSERGELLKYFASKLGTGIPRVAHTVAHLKELRDLYYLKSICDQYEAEGKPWRKCFWGSLKTNRHEELTVRRAGK